MENAIEIICAKENNLKGIDVKIPHNSLTVITGLSGSGKSSLAFDTLYAEGQRRYIESLSSYVRQFLGKTAKPNVQAIRGIPPAIAIEQKVNIRNTTSTVGSTTEIYDYMRLLFARVGKIFDEKGDELRQNTVDSVVGEIEKLDEGLRIVVLAPVILPTGRTAKEHFSTLLQQGFVRLESAGEFVLLQKVIEENLEIKNPNLVVDRLVVSREQDFRTRLTDSLETAFFEGGGRCAVEIFYSSGEKEKKEFSKTLEIDGVDFSHISEQMFNYNSPAGACENCGGKGVVEGIVEDLVVPDRTRTIYDDAVSCWRGEVMSQWKTQVIFGAEKSGLPIHKSYENLTEKERAMLWNGTAHFQGINAFFKWVETQQYKIQYRVMLARFRGKTPCPCCAGKRLKPQVQLVKIGGRSITELLEMPASDLREFFDNLTLDENDALIAKRLLIEIRQRLKFLVEVGLGYLQISRLSCTLSGGESQRINLVTSIGSGLVGSLYVLDEPSIGLHSRDTARLLGVMRALQAQGNTLVVVEHDEDIIRAADYLIDIGPEAGNFGGEVVFQGEMKKLKNFKPEKTSHTFNFLTGKEKIPVPEFRRKSSNYLEIFSATENNLKNLTVRVPLNCMVAVTGVSGSGKSTLIRGVLFRALNEYFNLNNKTPQNLRGSLHLLSGVEMIDQNPIGKSSRSNPATYLKAFDEIRRLFAEQPAAKHSGHTPAHFSFNTDGGRCPVCQGEGRITVEMQFMADLSLECEECHGRRFKPEILEVKFKGKNIFEVLEMTVDEALEFFQGQKTILRRLQPLADVGLGYIKLGQSSSSLSGGENQRVKLASFLAAERSTPMMFIFDEPTVGLHFHDISVLLKAFNALIERGHSLVIIEHNLEVIKCADYIIDLGAEGGNAGGELVFQGTPENLISCEKSHTAKFLSEKLKK